MYYKMSPTKQPSRPSCDQPPLTPSTCSRPQTETEYTDTRIEIEQPHHHHHHHHHLDTAIDVAERQYRERFRPAYHEQANVKYQQTIVDEETVEVAGREQPYFKESVKIEETVEPSRVPLYKQQSKMGYYDDEGKPSTPLSLIPTLSPPSCFLFPHIQDLGS